MEKENSSIKITSKWIAFFTFLIFIITSLISVVVYATNNTDSLKQNTQDIQEIKESLNSIEKIFLHMAEQEINSENRITKVETNYEHFAKQLDRIENKMENLQ